MFSKKDVTVTHRYGLHSKAATSFIGKANEFKSVIWVEKRGHTNRANGKSILGILSLGIVQGTEITIIADGADAEEAVNSLIELIEEGFDNI